MIGRSASNIKKIVLSLLIVTLLTGYLYSQNQNIGGVINIYKHVTAIGPGTDNITLNDVTNINVGDIVLLIQMKGSLIYVPETGSFGLYRESLGATGKYEFLVVFSVNPGTKVVVFTNPILNPYDITGFVQLVKVPFYNNSAIVTSTLTCAPWDSLTKTGGVLTMIVGKSLSLKANIDVTGKGFNGGRISSGIGTCTDINSSLYDKFGYPDTYNNSGFKGESQAIRAWIDPLTIPPIYPGYSKGKGNNFTAGGGGNGRYSGGGGGSNYGTGGKGGREMTACTPTPGDGGLGGRSVKTYDINGGIFLGSGGGASTYETAATASDGGRGGGIIIILTETLKGRGKIIAADGASPSVTATGNSGAGGGGGGGTVALYQQSYSTPLDSSALTVSANGGKGGNNAGQFGEGGGGGGGFVLTNNPSLPANVSKTVTGGAVGSRPGGSTGGAGAVGENLTTFSPVLNGFLFNSIRSAVTLDQVDSICSNVPFGVITGTVPVGGVPPYTILWQSSTASESGPWVDASGTNNANDYTPGLLTQTTWFRRVVTDNGPPVTIDRSKAVKIIVQQAITGNLVGKDTTICYNQNPLPLVPLNTGPSNGSSHNYYLYKWIQNNTNTSWNSSPDATGIFSNPGYDPPSLTGTTYYQRVVTSGRCVDYSSTVTITVLPLITGNKTIRSDSVICEGSLFTNLGASSPGGGDLVTYKYQWQDSITSSIWKPAPGTNTGTSYSPDISTFSTVEQRYLRRVVFSGPDSVCKSRSVPILLTRYHKILNNLILADRTICSGSSPAALTGSTPLQGKTGDYTYIWQDSSKVHTWTPISGALNINYPPPVLTDTTRYRRIVNSSVCTNTSKSVIVNVHKPIGNFNITLLAGGLTDTTICNGQIPHLIKGTVATGGISVPGSYAYQWMYSTNNSTFNPVPSGGTGVTYQPSALISTTWYKRQVISGACSEISNSVKVTVLPLIGNNNISAGQTVCYNTVPVALTGTAPTGGSGSYSYFWEQSTDNGTSWSAAAGTNNSASGGYSPPALTIKTKYRRNVKSGLSDCCTNVSNVITIDLFVLPTGTITNIADTTICGGSQTQLKILLTGAAPWKVTVKENTTDGTEIPVSLNKSIQSISPASPSAVNIYLYSLSKVSDNNGCIATSLTGNKKATVYRIPSAYAGPDQTVCGPKVTLSATPSVGTGNWIYPAALVASTVNNPSVIATVDSSFAGASISHKFYWQEINWQCKNKDSVIITFEKRIKSINAGPDTALFSFDNIFHTVADPPQSWEAAKWSLISGSGNFNDETDPKTTVTDLSKGINTYLWTITNGSCMRSDQLNVSVSSIEIPDGFSPNNDPDGYNNTFSVKGLDLVNQVADLKIVNGAGTEVFSTTNRDGQQWREWDGKNSKGIDLPEGTYYYLLKLISNGNNQVFKKSGFIILKRY